MSGDGRARRWDRIKAGGLSANVDLCYGPRLGWPRQFGKSQTISIGAGGGPILDAAVTLPLTVTVILATSGIHSGPMVSRRRAKAMRAAGTNQPYGKAYTRAFGDWMAERPWTKHIDTGTRSVLLWVADHRSEVEAWRVLLCPSFERWEQRRPRPGPLIKESASALACSDSGRQPSVQRLKA